MALKTAINGFGRIGRMVFRAGLNNPDIEFAAINDLTDPSTLAHLLKYDSVHGSLKAEVSSTDHSIIVNGKEIEIHTERNPASLPWDSLGIETVFRMHGSFQRQGKSLRSHHGRRKKSDYFRSRERSRHHHSDGGQSERI